MAMKRHILRLVSQEDHSFLLMLWQYVTVSQLAGSYWQCVCVVSCYLVVSEKMTKYLYLTAITRSCYHINQLSSTSRVYERGAQQVHWPGPGETRRGPWISEEPHVLNYRSFFSFFCSYFQLFLVYLEK
jgi:hypothetical protein